MTARKVWVSGLDLQSTGVGVIQRRLYSALESSDRWTLLQGRDRPEHPSPLGWAHYKASQLLARPRNADLALVTTTPRPLALGVPYVAVIYDLRWLRTAGRLKRWYREWELRTTVRHAQRILVISERTRDDLVNHLPDARQRVEILPLGPGQCSVEDFTDGEAGTVLLIGSAPHKRNRTMIDALALARPEWCRRIIGVNLNAADVKAAVDHLGPDAVEALTDVTAADMREVFKRASIYACLSVEEGFGIPFVEALCAGAHVVAIDQPLTRELLAGAGALLVDGDAAAIAAQLPGLGWPPAEVRRRRAAGYSWSNTARVAEMALETSDPR